MKFLLKIIYSSLSKALTRPILHTHFPRLPANLNPLQGRTKLGTLPKLPTQSSTQRPLSKIKQRRCCAETPIVPQTKVQLYRARNTCNGMRTPSGQRTTNSMLSSIRSFRWLSQLYVCTHPRYALPVQSCPVQSNEVFCWFCTA